MATLAQVDAPSIRCLALARGDIHVWTVHLSDALAQKAARHLSAAEQDRAHRFIDGAAQRNYLATHGALRALLARYCGQPPAALHFTLGVYGKPCLEPPHRIAFNLSRSGEIALIGIGLDTEIGIDIERRLTLDTRERMIEGFYCAEECSALSAMAPWERDRAFFDIWSRKEALLKATGEGLLHTPNSFNVLPCDRPGPINVTLSGASWAVSSLALSRHHSAAVAHPSGYGRIFQFTGSMIANLSREPAELSA